MKNEIKYHTVFGEVEILELDGDFTIIKIIATGEEKKIVNKFAKWSTTPVVVKAKKVKTEKQEAAKEKKYEQFLEKVAANKKANDDIKNGTTDLSKFIACYESEKAYGYNVEHFVVKFNHITSENYTEKYEDKIFIPKSMIENNQIPNWFLQSKLDDLNRKYQDKNNIINFKLK